MSETFVPFQILTAEEMNALVAGEGEGGGAVSSVNGETGDVVLGVADIAGAYPAANPADYIDIAALAPYALIASPLSLFAAPVANIAMNAFKLTGLRTPSAAGDSAEYSWVIAQLQSAAAGIVSEAPVRLLASGNVSLSGLAAVDGVTPSAGDRILVVGQTTTTQNGSYIAAAGAWARASPSEMVAGALWLVSAGTANAGSQWRLATTGTITVGSTAISIVQFGAAANYTAGVGITLTGNVFAADTTVLLPKSGGTLTGALLLSGAPTTGLAAATKTYTDAADATNASAIGTETTRAEAAEASSATAITSETSRAETAEALLAPKLNPTFTTSDGTLELLPGQAVNVFTQTGDTGHRADFTWNVVTNASHTSADNSALAISSRVVGSGTPGPAAADYGMTISVIKDSWPTSTTQGEIDGLTIVTRQGTDDTAGILVNVGCVAGFSAVLEGQSYQFAPTSGTILAGGDVQLAGLETGATGIASYIGYLFSATTGTWTGLQIQAQAPGSIGMFINCVLAGGATPFQVLATGAVSSAAGYNGANYDVSGLQVVGARKTGWTAGTGATPNLAAMNYGTATLAQLAARVMALEQMLTAHGLMGP